MRVLKLGGIFLLLKAINAIAHHIYHQRSHKSLQKAASISVSLFEHSQQNHRKLLVRPVLNSPLQVALSHQTETTQIPTQPFKEEMFISQHVFRTPCWSDLGSCTETLSWPDKGNLRKTESLHSGCVSPLLLVLPKPQISVLWHQW